MSTDITPARPNRGAVLELLPNDTVLLRPARETTPMRAVAGAWGFVVRAIALSDRATIKDPVRRGFLGPVPPRLKGADVLAGIWRPSPPPADIHHGDIALRLVAPLDDDPAVVDVELASAKNGAWGAVKRWSRVGADWPDIVAQTVHYAMEATICNNYARAVDSHLAPISEVIMDSFFGSGPRRRLPTPDALADLIDARLIRIGTRVRCGEHFATVAAGGVLTDGTATPTALTRISTVSSRATQLAGTPVNGWHTWRTPEGVLLDDLRIALAATR